MKDATYSQRILDLPVSRYNPTHEYVAPEEMRAAAAEIAKEADARIKELEKQLAETQASTRIAVRDALAAEDYLDDEGL